MLKLSASTTMQSETGVATAAPVFSAFSRLRVLFPIVLLTLSVSAWNIACAADLSHGAGRRVELIKLVRNDCGSCHGIRLTGGLGPALTPQALTDKSEKGLVATILYGRSGTPMPPWQAFMTEAEAVWIVENLMQGFPDAQSN